MVSISRRTLPPQLEYIYPPLLWDSTGATAGMGKVNAWLIVFQVLI